MLNTFRGCKVIQTKSKAWNFCIGTIFIASSTIQKSSCRVSTFLAWKRWDFVFGASLVLSQSGIIGPIISVVLIDTEFSLLCLSFMNINLLGIRKIVSGSRSFLMQFVSGLLKFRLFLGKKFNLRHVTTKINSGDFTHLFIRWKLQGDQNYGISQFCAHNSWFDRCRRCLQPMSLSG